MTAPTLPNDPDELKSFALKLLALAFEQGASIACTNCTSVLLEPEYPEDRVNSYKWQCPNCLLTLRMPSALWHELGEIETTP